MPSSSRHSLPAAADRNAFTPPPTDGGNLGALKYPFSQAHNRRTAGGWAREVTVRQLPIAKAIAGVNMRLVAGGIRELHWHLQSEWAYMLSGRARITAVDEANRTFIADVNEGDLWFFPSGIPHAIQGLEPDGCEFLLAFDDGAFSEDSTFLITDWLAHTPKDVLAKNFGQLESLFAQLPGQELYIFNGRVPGSIEADRAQSNQPDVPESFAYRLLEQPPIRTSGGSVRIVDSTNFKASKAIAAACVEVEPGGLRELHWHPHADEWQYYISGSARMTVFAGGGAANTIGFTAGDVGYVPQSFGHYIENTGPDTLRFLELFAADRYADVSLTGWMANSPRQLVADHLRVDEAIVAALSQVKQPVVPG